MSSLVRRVLASVAVLALVAAACGDDSDGAAEAPDTTAAPAATTAAPATTRAPAATTQAPAATTQAPAATAAPSDPDRIAQAGDTVAVHYVGTLDDGEEFDSSLGREPLSFVIDGGQVIPGFDEAVAGMMVGDVVTVRIEPVNAYGEWTEERVVTVDKNQVPEDTEVGGELFSPQGQRFLVLEVTDTEVTLDGNHPLAGEALTFEIELVSFDS